MSKGLEALENIKREAGTPYFSSLYDIDDWKEDFKIIEKNLERLECLEKENQELTEENNKLKKALKIIMKWRRDQIYDLIQNLEHQNMDGFETLEEVLENE